MAIQKCGASFQKHPQLTDTSAAYSYYTGYGGYEISHGHAGSAGH